jgi:tRNA pseudouridine55 synthase
MEGVVVINKPDGITSHDVVARIRKKLGLRRVGHAGTLDPLATGVLVILLGKSTKLFDKFVAFDKAYIATLILGQETTSADIQGKLVRERDYTHITREAVERAFVEFTGEIQQLPPMVSAVKKNGKKLYEFARKGIVVERQPRSIRIDRLEIVDFNPPHVKFYVECSKGTYIRQLAQDVGEYLGCGACISQIERTKVGSFSIKDAIKIEDLNESHILNWKG